MAKKPSALLEELKQLSPKRKTWLDSVSPELMADLLKIKELANDPANDISGNTVHAWLKANSKGVKVDVGTIRKWLRGDANQG